MSEKARKTNLIFTTMEQLKKTNKVFATMEQIKKTSKIKKTESTTVHNSKVEPFQIVQVTTTNEETKKESTKFMIGVCGQFVSKKEFKTLENAEKYISTRPWELIINLNYITIKMVQEYEESKSNR